MKQFFTGLFLFFAVVAFQSQKGHALEYTIEQIPYSPAIPFPATEGTQVSLTTDSFASIPIGFTFNFFGVDYTNLFVGSNGYLTFNTGETSGTPQTIPTTSFPASLFGFWQELDPSTGSLYYTILGSAPNRELVISYNNLFISPGASFLNMQIILHESSNIIEFQINSVTYDGLSYPLTQGIQNQNGTVAFALPGRNNQIFEVSLDPEGWTFTAPQPPVLLQGRQVKNKFLSGTDYVNIITWEPAIANFPIEAYYVYADSTLTELLAIIPVSGPLIFEEHNQIRDVPSTYYIVTSTTGGFSYPATVTIY